MQGKESQDLAGTLSKLLVHERWEADYRTPANEAFYNRVFDDFLPYLKPKSSIPILDAGCGPGFHSVRLARRGFRVLGVDFSENVLQKAVEGFRNNHVEDRIHVQRASLLCLPFQPDAFDAVLCWGVLMHIPDLASALDELSRVTRKGGTLIISEANMRSLQSTALRIIKRLLHMERASVRETPAGIEYWTDTGQGRLLTRECRVKWLAYELEKRGFVLKRRRAGQLTEMYTRFRSPRIQGLIHACNRIWYSVITFPLPAFGNILLFKKSPALPGSSIARNA